jgi:hypothetical protein
MTEAKVHAELALLRAVGNLSQDADALRRYVNVTEWHAQDLETYVARVMLAAAQVRNRFEEYENA